MYERPVRLAGAGFSMRLQFQVASSYSKRTLSDGAAALRASSAARTGAIMKPTQRRYGRAAPVRHEAWIDRRSARTSEAIRRARRKDPSTRIGNQQPALNDNFLQAAAIDLI